MLTNPSPNPAALSRLIIWTHHPADGVLEDVLAALDDADLLFMIRVRTSMAAARLAWAEYGRRHRFIDFELSVVQTAGDVSVHFVGDAMPVQEAPVYGVDVPKLQIPHL